ncbi:PAS domain S-box protein [Ancylomarina salipaludis]|uniref:histidine kinase n=1 Tax=Ancylomarina salipaludis TaxID=2501299 RepID=A0A4Q1JPF6_9BACT|nr:PAS domain S-box protein [Ancylomarina salipaludis]RXQ96790.1 PAS domain S-box protein [Ancylomarina salipaludis]
MGGDLLFPEFIFTKWQELLDLLSLTFNLPATLIMHANEDSMEVFARSINPENPYRVGDSEKMAGLYCETVVKSESSLLVANALTDLDWVDNPDVKLGMIAYLGFPLMYPNGDVFGTICTLDKKENHFTKQIQEFLIKLKEIVELDIAAYYSYEGAKNKVDHISSDQLDHLSQVERTMVNIEPNRQKEYYKNSNTYTTAMSIDLMEEDNKYKALFSSMNSGLVVYEPIFDQNGNLCDARYLDMNTRNEELIGHKKEEIIGKTLLEVFPKTDAIWISNFDQVFKKKIPINFESYYSPLGKYFSVSAFLIEENVFAFSFHDISEHVIVKQRLIDSEKKYKTLFNHSNTVMMLVDPKDSSIVDANASAIKFYGFPKKDLLSMKMIDINNMTKEALQHEIDLAVKKKKNHFQLKHRLASGDVRDVEVYTGTLISDGKTLLHSVIHDVTDRCLALEKVNRLSMVVEQSPVAIMMTDISGNISYCNAKLCEYTGYSVDEMIGQNPSILKSGKFSKKTYSKIWRTILSGRKWKGEFYNKKKDGSFYWESATIAPIKNAKNEIVNFIKMGEDITERKRLENQLLQSKLKAEESDMLKSLFLANLSHELRTPLNGIMGFTNLMLSDDISDKERKEYGAFVESSGNQLLTMMDGILKLSVIEAGEMSVKYSSFRVNDLLNEIVNYYAKDIANKKLNLHWDCDCQSLVRSDKKRIRQVFDILIQNAIKFTEKGGIVLAAECNNNMLVLSVKDTGIGIAAENHTKVFERFRQVDDYSTREFGGTGLGLALSKEIVTLLGGEIWIESEVGKGAKFIFTIPNVDKNEHEHLS